MITPEESFNKPFVEFLNKSKEEQEKEFAEYISHYATKNCKYCHGTGKEYWLFELEQYKVCGCVLKNIRIEQELIERRN